MASHPITPVKSHSDARVYRVIKLKNELEAILISDPNTDKAGAAIDVHVGHFSDPNELPGLAHFLEHMLFMGTKTFPDENEYSRRVSEHGGRSNAYTSTENTNYYFDVIPEHLEKILELFAGFFTEPLFEQSATDREMKAVHSENAQNLLNDAWRQYQLVKSTSNPDHPFSKFGTGNLETLLELPKSKNIDTREALLKFHKDYYSANIMKLCLLGKESLDDLQALAEKHFSNIANSDVKVPTWSAEPFGKESLGHMFEIVPIKEMRRVGLAWGFPTMRPHYKKKPSSLLGHLFGHEGKGSILSALKKLGWANELSGGLSNECTSFSSFLISIDVTPAGLENFEKIVVLIYEYIRIVLEAKNEEWELIFKECHDVSAMNFRFKGKESPFNYCSSVAGRLHKYNPKDVLEGPWKYQELDIKLVRTMVELMKPENMRLHLISQTFKGKTELKEKWYASEYNKKKLSEEFMARCRTPPDSKLLHLPNPNEFIATNFDLVHNPGMEGKKVFPTKIVEEKGVVAWHKTDNVFLKPKGHVFLSITLPKLFVTPRINVLEDLFVLATEESLSEFTYDADIALLQYSLNVIAKGLQLQVAGYTHKLPILLYKVVERIKNLTVEPGVFDRLRERAQRKYANFFKQQPYVHAFHNQGRAMGNQKWSASSKLDEIKTITAEELQAFAKTVIDDADLEFFIFGNFSKKQAEEIVDETKKILKCKPLVPSMRPQLRSVQLDSGATYIIQRKGFNEDDPNSCVCALYQVGENTYPKRARLSMLTHLIQEPAFDQLRTKEQLGYSVFSMPSHVYGSLNMLIIVQSPTKGAKYLDDRIKAFLNKYRADLAGIDEKTFEANKSAVIKKKREKDKKLSEEAKRHWNTILYKQYKFDRVEEEVAQLEKLKLQDVLDFFDTYVAISATRAHLTTQIFGKESPIPGVGDEEGKDEAKMKTEEAEKEESGKEEAKKEEAQNAVHKSLPPVPKDTTKQIKIGDLDEFVYSMPLFPCFHR
eukprot:CAMPEP_0114521978 /NCGR_PEP_ID=MMETSP0109-20121206/20500_1 /TAXON_ID=29199 /ORGANISM="Chlorarachnion reptans, Strain CCCM449" /LENGTH=994 /DNA_ID=CAMNT_0001703171 /DNA_START=54 /DNA_END=3038 /DNA_ORIENTATION=+